LKNSGLPLLYEDYVAACTYEGENTIMHLQTARFLMKVARQSLDGEKMVGNCKYLENLANHNKRGEALFSFLCLPFLGLAHLLSSSFSSNKLIVPPNRKTTS